MNIIEIDDIIKLTKTATDQNYFEYNSNFYKQKDGLAMGSPLSGLLANIFINDLETSKIINKNNPFYKNIIYWYRYIDDIICLFNGNEVEKEEFFNFLNTLSNKIKFTMENQNKQINFLDLTITNEENKHTFSIYHKQTQTDLIIPSNSNHPWTHKMAVFYSLAHRLLNIPMNQSSFYKEKTRIRQISVNNGYKANLFDKILEKIKNKKSLNQNKNIGRERKEYICVPFNKKINKAIRKTFSKSKFHITYRNKNNSFNLIKNKIKEENTQIDPFMKSGIYKIKCNDCNQVYIGQTGRNFKCRFKEHIQALRTNNQTSMKSTFAEHLLKENHTYSDMKSNMEILSFETKGDRMNIKEEFYIYLNSKKYQQNLLNTMITQRKNPIFEKILEMKI